MIGKTPFLRLLLPVVAGIVTAMILPWQITHSLPFGFAGALLMLFSFFVRKEQRYNSRWLFGGGLFLFLFSLGALQYRLEEQRVYPDFPREEHYFVGTLLDIPETKPRSIACHVKTRYPVKKRVILYLQQTDESRSLVPGDELLFRATMQPFQNFGNPDDFDYVRFMRIKGFSGSAYVPTTAWHKTGRQHLSLSILSQRCRAVILDFYRSFQLNPDAHAFITAVTLGYKAYLSDDLQEAFRASGTAQVLAVSGLHVGIIYMIINFLFSFLGRSGRRYAIRQFLVVIALWYYAMIAGMSAPVIRAAFMLTIYCLGQAWNRAGFTYNTLAGAAFFLLLLRPFSLIDLSFQMSFMAVFAILFFQPKIGRLYKPKGRVSRYLWNLSTVSLSAQLGVFPLVLYHFGSFPTYFFIANLCVVPLLSLAIYAAIPLIAISLLPLPDLPVFTGLEVFFQQLLGRLIELLLHVVYITEMLPYSQLTNKYLSFPQLFLLLIFVYSTARFLVSRISRPLLVALSATLLFLITSIHGQLTRPLPSMVVFNRPSESEFGIYANNRRHYIDLPENGLLPHPTRSILLLSDDTLEHFHTEEPFPLDVLILSRHGDFNIEKLLHLFDPEIIVLDSSFPRFTANKFQHECDKWGVKLHDVSLHGAYVVTL